MRKLAFPLLVVATLWNMVIVGGVALNSDWVLTRAAGGQFESFPIALRTLYGIEVFLMGAQIYFARLLVIRHGAWNLTSWRLATFLIALYVLSTLVNAMSRSANERFNAPFALVIAWAFYQLMRREKPTR